jgi:putative glutamine amidotransferase
MRRAPLPDRPPPKPVIGVLCCNEIADRPIQAVASRFIEPLVRFSGATVLLVPALIDTLDAQSLGERLDGLLLTGARSNVASGRYGGRSCSGTLDEQRDEVALALAGHMIEIGRPVFGICRGLQELNVLFGGTLQDTGDDHYHSQGDLAFETLFHHRHEVRLAEEGRLARAAGSDRIEVNSVHRQGIDRLGAGLAVEAVASHDGLVEAFSGPACGAEILAVQWHPEWNTAACPASLAFFTAIGAALRAGRAAGRRRQG